MSLRRDGFLDQSVVADGCQDQSVVAQTGIWVTRGINSSLVYLQSKPEMGDGFRETIDAFVVCKSPLSACKVSKRWFISFQSTAANFN